MTRQLRISWGDLTSYLISNGTPLGISRIINVPTFRANWRLSFRLDVRGEVIFEAAPGSGVPGDGIGPALLSGTVPEVLNSLALVVREGDTTERYEGLQEYLVVGNESSELPEPYVEQRENHQGPVLTARGYYGSKIHAELSDPDQVRDYLKRWTWLGSIKYRTTNHHVTWQVTTRSYTYACKSLVAWPSERLVEIASRLGTIRLAIGGVDEDLHGFRHAEYGQMSDHRQLRPLRDALKDRGLSSWVCEVDSDAFRLVAPGQVALARPVDEEVSEAAEKVRRSSAVSRVVSSLESSTRERATRRLNARIREAKAAPRLLYRGREIAREPRSELGTVALFHKLEGMGALPFAYFNSIAWAAAEGIDMIADFQLKADEALRSASPIEFEFEFSSFIRHRHPHTHVEAIVCWRVDTTSAQLLSSGGLEWLSRYRIGESAIPVVEIRGFPELRVEWDR